MKESLEINSKYQNLDNNNDSDTNKLTLEDIICTYPVSYFPQPQIGKVRERYIDTIDYMVGMKEFDAVFKKLNIDNNYFNRENKIYSVLDIDAEHMCGV